MLPIRKQRRRMANQNVIDLLDAAVESNILGLTDAPAIDPMGLVNINRGSGEDYAQSNVNMYGNPARLRPDGTYSFPIQQAPMLGPEAYAPIKGFFGPLQAQRELLDKLFASGVMSAPEDYSSPVDVGQVPGHRMSSDTYGYQAGLKAHLPSTLPERAAYSVKQLGNIKNRDPDVYTDDQWNLMQDSKLGNFINLYGNLPEAAGNIYDQSDTNERSGFFAPLAAGTIPAGGLQGKALNQWLREGNVLRADTPGSKEFRGITAKDVPKTKFGDYAQDAKRLAKRTGGFFSRTSPLTLGLSAALHSPDLGDSYVEDLDTLQPFNFDEVDSGTVESFFDIPPVVNENTLMMNSLMPISTDSGTVIVEDTPEGTILTDNTPVDVMPWGAGEQYMDAQGFDTVMPVLNPFDVGTEAGVESIIPDLNAAFNYVLDLRPETTAEEFDDFITSQILGVDIPEETTVTPTVVPDLSAIGINPTPDYTWQEVLGMGQPGPGGPVRPAFNVDEFGNRASLARFTEPEVDTDDFIRENLIEAVAPAPTVTRSQPGPGGPVRESQKDREAREAREQGAKDKKKPKPKPKPKPRKKPKPKPKPVATQPTVTRDTDWVRKSLEEHDKLFGKKANPYAWKGIKKIAPGATRGIIY